MNLLIIFLFNFYVKGYLSPDSTGVKIDYHLGKGVSKIELIYEYRGKNYIVGEYRNSDFEKDLKDKFIWVTKKKWRKDGNLKLIVFYIDKSKKEYFISGRNLQIADFLIKEKSFKKENLVEIEKGHYINPSFIKTYQGPDKYAWRMSGYDAQHSGYYPFPLYPPLNFKWMKNWEGSGAQITEVSGCIAHDMLFLPDPPHDLNVICAFDIKTGEILWERIVTANTMTSGLCEGDSILFVGTCIGFTPDSDTTFYALDPFTGNLKWAKILRTIQYQPVVVDTFVYVRRCDKNICLFTYRGKFLWSVSSDGFYSPAYYNERIYHAYPNNVLNAIDALTGNPLWNFEAPFEIGELSIHDNKVFFFAYDTLFGVNLFSGIPQLKIIGFPHPLWIPVHFYNKKIWVSYGEYGAGDTIFSRLKCFDSRTGDLYFDIYLSPKDTNGGEANSPLFTKNGVGWLANVDYIYVFNSLNGIVFDTTLLPEFPTCEPSRFFPIIYKNYYIYAHRDLLCIYQADTVIPDTNPPDTNYVLKFYPYFSLGNLYLYLSLPEQDEISLKLYDVSGRKVEDIYNGFLSKGEHIFNISSKKLFSGIYFSYLKTKSYKKISKIAFIKVLK
ncbi:MAG: PQQ-binding-like beta-propeller repeat protein [candidate division WOR-3 bacterium]